VKFFGLFCRCLDLIEHAWLKLDFRVVPEKIVGVNSSGIKI